MKLTDAIEYGIDELHLLITYKISLETMLPIILIVTVIGLAVFNINKITKNTSNQNTKQKVNKDDLRCKASFDLDYGGESLNRRLGNVSGEPSNPKKYSSLYMEFDKNGKKI